MLRLTRLLVAGMVMLLIACESPNNTSTENLDEFSTEVQKRIGLNEAFSIAFGERIELVKLNLIIEFAEVKSDSRCPVDVVCFWAGNAQFILIVNEQEYEINSYVEPRDILPSGFKIRLLETLPVPYSDIEREPGDYSLQLIVEKASENE